MMVDVDRVVPNPQQPRQYFDEEALATLADSLSTEGLLNPISVIGPVDGLYVLEDGERRLRAARMAGWAQIEASVKEPNGNVNDTSLLIRALVGNLQREDMGPVDEARAYERLVVLGMTQREIGERVGRSQSNISSRMRMLQFPDEVQELFNQRRLPLEERVMYALRSMPEESQVRAAKMAATRKLDASRFLGLCTRMMNAHPRVNDAAVIKAQRSDETAPALSMNGEIEAVSVAAMTDAIRTECHDCGLADDLVLCRSCPLQRFVSKLVAMEEK